MQNGVLTVLNSPFRPEFLMFLLDFETKCTTMMTSCVRSSDSSGYVEDTFDNSGEKLFAQSPKTTSLCYFFPARKLHSEVFLWGQGGESLNPYENLPLKY